VSGPPVINGYGPLAKEKGMEIGVRAGRHVLRARDAKGNESAPWEVEPAPGARETHVFTIVEATPLPSKAGSDARPAPFAPKASKTVPWIVAGVGGAMLVGAAVSGIVVMNKVSKLESKCPDDTCPNDAGLDADRDSAKKWMRATDVLLVGGGVLVTTSVLWLLLSNEGGPPSEGKPRPSARLSHPAFGCAGNGCTFSLTGSF
jgi:hypothetical protein